MSRTKLFTLVISIAVLFAASSYAVENDYLAVIGQPRLTHSEKIISGDPYTAEVSLNRVGIVPRGATLNVSTAAVNPVIKITIDGSEQTFTSQLVSMPLAESGVTDVEIKISGNAPTVSTDTQVDMVSVITYAVYDDLNKGPQEEIIRSLVVTNPEIEEAVRTVNEAKSKLLEAETAISDLKAQNIDTTSLETRLELERDRIKDAENSKARGFPIEAKRQADNAILSLEGIISDARSRTQRVYDIKSYATVAVVIIIALIGISVLRRKREELG
jgi:hypothetical protein